MSLSIGKYIKWCSLMPFINRSQQSPTFLIQNTECYFTFSCKYSFQSNFTYYYYYLYLQSKTNGAKLKSFSFTIYSDIAQLNCFKNYPVTFYKMGDYIHGMEFSVEQVKDRAAHLVSGCFVNFLFEFKNEDGPLLPLETENEEKATQADLLLEEKAIQADLMSSLETDVEFISLDFGELLKNGDHTDVQLLCNGGSIPAHRAILAARSKVFSDMFQPGTNESQKGLINLTTTEISVMQLCLEFIYKGKVLDLRIEKSSNLYVLGHVLKIPTLTKMCADLMVTHSSEDNYISYLILAAEHNDEYFMKGLVDYIADHVKLLKSENWKQFSKDHMKAANDVYEKCILNLI